MNNLLTLSDFYARLNAAVRSAGSARAFAESFGLSPSYVSEIANAKKQPSPIIAASVGLKPVLMFQEIRQSANSGAA